MDQIRDDLKNLKKSIQRTVRDRADSVAADANQVNVVDDKNIVVAATIGGRGRHESVSTRQEVRVTQNGRTTHKVRTTETGTSSDSGRR